MEFLIQILLGALFGGSITVTDRIVEHGWIQNKFWKHLFAYISIFISIATIGIISQYYQELIPFLIGMNLYWVFSNKLDTPEFVFYIFSIGIIFGQKISLNIEMLSGILFTIFLFYFFRIPNIKKWIQKKDKGDILYKYMGRFYLIGILYWFIFHEPSIFFFNSASILMSFIIAKKYQSKKTL
ncbi:hypothetical protein COW06_00610 [Candidatus Gracilibacteria bacterium CG12_big_fil_rev_8_21_14_0_65_38_15]|nr:MAG: hypothetical protein COW68_04115 [Candidatus Gracilibacteria bacterium CG18_big_fil_WC_8_21_14_2_50_38_16]PIQ42152.1 MAG: hypothetical protein COW06_00610 [Candidatus Gracilibacteria bacterium CG12_big_fil_rev_8_21_14_0_65_38_15]PIZ02019.1 MAG: hypothetical protein COY60_00550 [Candidatus Gracilibacteria bacterium CG_4_10_14_0_8_um_filter_38_28]